MDADGPRDPFADESGGPWHQTFRRGEIVFNALAELDTIIDVAIAMKAMEASDLQAVVYERLYSWHRARNDPPGSPPMGWLTPRQADPDS